MEKQDNPVEIVKEKVVWKRSFTFVLLMNIVYMYLFYLLMNHFA